MIDIHTHILAGLDDGPKDWAESIDLARLAVENGITKAVATPHYQFRSRLNGMAEVQERIQVFQALLVENDINLTLFPGNEVFVNSCFSDVLRSGKFITLNDTGRYVLLEIPGEYIPVDMDEIIFGFKVKGVAPVLAHPERNQQVSKNPNLLIKFIECGALIQVNACSLVGKHGSQTARTAEIILINNMAHFIASDMHCPKTRVPLLARAWKKAKALVGDETAERLVSLNPQKAVSGLEVRIDSPERYRSFFGFFRSRS